jgi:NAD+ kinase
MRPVVIRDDATLTITTRSRTALYQLSIDGDSVGLPSGTALTITRAPFEAQVVLLNDYNFASTLRNKLMWGKDNREE